ncbi:MAG: AraC family transcriptional regulator [Bacteroidales bacterium]|nr:AraC family transcriptional regulator [Bacteroidales bacterium]
MSSAGKTGILSKIGSLLEKLKQAPSVSVDRVADAVNRWEKSRGYLLPEGNPSQVAKRMGITSAQLFRYCLEVKGEDFRTWRTRLRIEEAKRQLVAEPDVPCSVIARRVGINDRSNFSRLFREHTGMLPSEFRAKSV